MSTQHWANRHICWRIRTPGSREARKETRSESQPRLPPEPPGLSFPPGRRYPSPRRPPTPALAASSWLPPGPRPRCLSRVAEVLCGVNGASAKAGGWAGAEPGLWEPGCGASGRPGLCLGGPAGQSAFPWRPARPLRGGWAAPCSPRGGGSLPTQGSPCPTVPTAPRESWL